jgi:hypothetical protein
MSSPPQTMSNGYRATIHWENLASLASEHESLEIGSDLFEIDRSLSDAVVDQLVGDLGGEARPVRPGDERQHHVGRRGYRATIHWENLASLASEHESLEIGSDLFEIDRTRV